MIKILIECEKCNEKFFIYLKCEKINQFKEVEIYVDFICSNCNVNIKENKIIKN